jgi:hypothetical protein
MSKKSGSRNPPKHSLLHILNVNCCDLHRNRSALDRLYRVLVGVDPADRKLLHRWSFAVLLVWVLLISVYILDDNLRGC